MKFRDKMRNMITKTSQLMSVTGRHTTMMSQVLSMCFHHFKRQMNIMTSNKHSQHTLCSFNLLAPEFGN
jgi:hypothetical protein